MLPVMPPAVTAQTQPGRMSPGSKALLCLALFITFQLFADCGALHRWIHPDAASPQHVCALTLFSHGQLNAPGCARLVVPFLAILLCFTPLFQAACPASPDRRLSPSRGPPRR